MSLLLVDDDTRLANMLLSLFEQHGLACEHAATLQAARNMLQQRESHNQTFDACVLDVNLPDGNGMDFCRELRANAPTQTLPILMFTARGETLDKVLGLELGADDYLSKPFEPRELIARIRALLRRSQLQHNAAAPSHVSSASSASHTDAASNTLTFDNLCINPDARTVTLSEQPAELSSHQFDLLLALAQNAGRVLSRDQIMQHLRGHDSEAFDRSIDVHISRIRAAIEDNPKKPRRIVTVRGVGYVFNKTANTVPATTHTAP